MIRLLLMSSLRVPAATTVTPHDFARQFSALQRDAPWLALVAGVSDDASQDSYLNFDYLMDGLRRGVLQDGERESGFVAVPSGADMARGRSVRAAERTLSLLWENIANDFWSDDTTDERQFVSEAFQDFTEVTTAAVVGIDGTPWAQGLLPGDGSSSIAVGRQTVGLLAVNTAFRAESTGQQATIGQPQLDVLTAQSPGTWAAGHDTVCVLLATPIAELGDASRTVLSGLSPDKTGTPLVCIAPAGAPEGTIEHRPDGTLVLGVPDFGPLDDGAFMVLSIEPSNRKVRLSWRTHGGNGPAGTVSHHVTHAVAPMRAPVVASPVTKRGAAQDSDTEESALAMEVAAAFLGHLESGRVVAVLGNGFSGPVTCRSDLHGAVPLASELGNQLFRLAFGEAPPASTSLDAQELLDAALERDREMVLAYLEQALTPMSDADMGTVARLLDVPWSRVYDVTPALTSTMGVRQSAARVSDYALIDATTDYSADREALVDLVHLRGTVASRGTGDRPLFRLDPLGGGDAKGPLAWWSKEIEVDVRSNPTVFVAASVHELWPYISMRQRGKGATLGPGYLVCDDLPRDVELRLKAMRVSVLSLSVASFAQDFLRRHQERVVEGRRRRAARWKAQHSATGIQLVGRLRADAPTGRSAEYLRGFEPTWGDVRDGLSVTLRVEDQILSASGRNGENFVPAVVVGRAGTGKSSTLMRLAIGLDVEGHTVGWIDRSASDPIQDLVASAEALECDVLFVDDAEFGLRTPRFLTELSANGKRRVIAAMRTPRYELLMDPAVPHTRISHDVELSNDEIWSLLNLLERAGMQGQLRRLKTRAERFQAFRSKSKSELLIGLYEVTSGVPFTLRLKTEFDQLDGLQHQIYSRLAVATHLWEDEAITEREIMLALAGMDNADVRNEIDKLIKMHFLKRVSLDRLRVRHRVFADVTVDFLAREPALLAEAVGDLLYVFAAKARNIRDRGQRDRRLMIRLLNHTLMTKLKLSEEAVDGIYAGVRELLDEDFHFWLQRGAYAIERGKLELGENYLLQARNCDRGDQDFMVLTEWGNLRLRQANKAPDSPEAREHGREGFLTLVEVARRTGKSSPHTFAMLARDGTQWLKSCTDLSGGERRELAQMSLTLLEWAKKHLSDNRQAFTATGAVLPTVRKLAAEGGPEPFMAPLV